MVLFGNQTGIRSKVASISELQSKSDDLNSDIAKLENSTTKEFQEKKDELSKTIKEYNEVKKQYEELIPQTENSQTVIDENLKDIYDVDFLWTIVGNYATEEGINLNFDISKNITSASSINNTSSTYVVCDLKFTVTGNYINLTDFIYDLEDDDRLNFEINSFNMQKSGDGLQVTFTVKEIKLNNTNLIDTIVSTPQIDSTQEINSNTTNTTNTSNTANTTNTTNTTSNSVSNSVN